MKPLPLFCTFTIALFASVNISAQVGIGTTDPKEMLHVGGNDSTIRIDGFNSTNNPNNDGSGKVALSVDAEGNLVLEKPVNDRFINEENILPTPDHVGTKTAHGFAHKRIYSYQVITTNEAKLVYVSYQTGLKLTQEDKPLDGLDDNHEAKMYGMAIVVNLSPDTVTEAQLLTSAFATSSQAITNGDKNKMFDHKAFLNGQAMIMLEPNKTHYIHLICYVNNSDSSKGVRAIYGGNGNLDRFQLFELN